MTDLSTLESMKSEATHGRADGPKYVSRDEAKRIIKLYVPSERVKDELRIVEEMKDGELVGFFFGFELILAGSLAP